MRWTQRFIQKLVISCMLFFKVDDTSCYVDLFLNENKTKPKIEGKIVGGIPTPIERYPYAAILFNYGSLCGGSILTSWAVLTAAHCFDINDDVYDMTVHVAIYPLLAARLSTLSDSDGGSLRAMSGALWAAEKPLVTSRHTMKERSYYAIALLPLNIVQGARHKYDSKSDVRYVQHLERHKDYNKAMPFACDIALLFVEAAFSFSNRVQRAILVDNDMWMKKDEKNFTVTGWGMIRYNGPISDLGLLMANLRFIPRDECGKLHDMTFTEDMFCLYGDGVQDTCKGDSGGGVIWNGLLVGIVSHGDGCAGKGKPSVYANVFYFRDWISNRISEFYKNSCNPLEKTTSRRAKKLRNRRFP